MNLIIYCTLNSNFTVAGVPCNFQLIVFFCKVVYLRYITSLKITIKPNVFKLFHLLINVLLYCYPAIEIHLFYSLP